MKKLILIIATLVSLTGCSPENLENRENQSISDNTINSVISSSYDVSYDPSSSDISGSSQYNEPDTETNDPDNFKELSAEEITAAMGLGWNLGNQFEASIGGVPSETAWGNPPVREELFKVVKQAGFSTVRIPVSYLSMIGADNTIDAKWLERVREAVDLALGQGLFVIINIHGDGYYTVDGAWLKCAENDTAQNEITEKFGVVWKQIAERFKDYDEHLIFESMNEIFDGTYGEPDPHYYRNLNEYNRVFVDTVRKTGSNNTQRWLLIPGWNTNIEYTAGDHGFVIPDDNTNGRLMISVHYYDPYNFTLNEDPYTATTQWGKNASKSFDSWGQEDYAEEMFAKLYEAFVIRGYPVIIGEFGASDKSRLDSRSDEFRSYWAAYIVSAAKRSGCVPIYWDNGWNGEFGLAVIDRSSLTVTQPGLIGAMINAMN